MDIRWPWHYLIEAFRPSTRGFQGNAWLDAFACTLLVFALVAEVYLARIVMLERAAYFEALATGTPTEDLTQRWVTMLAAPMPYLLLCISYARGRWLKFHELAVTAELPRLEAGE